MSRDATILVGGQIIWGVHSDAACHGEHCTVHNPSEHHMRNWEQLWNGSMYRICEHNELHHDPDHAWPVELLCGCSCGCCVLTTSDAAREIVSYLRR